jgi:hypothetical protein
MKPGLAVNAWIKRLDNLIVLVSDDIDNRNAEDLCGMPVLMAI